MLRSTIFESYISNDLGFLFLVFHLYLGIELHFVGVHGPYELHRKEKQMKCTALAVHFICFYFRCKTRCISFAFFSDAIHMAREHRQNAIQCLYLHLLTTKFVAILLTLTQKCHISQISNEQKVRHLEQPSRRKTN